MNKKILSMTIAAVMAVGGMTVIPQNEMFVPVIAEAATSSDEMIYENLMYTQVDEHVEITGCTEGSMSIEIPDEIDGLPVTKICDTAFQESEVVEVTLGNNITSIGRSAFWGCSSLSEINIPKTVASIGWRAFKNCSSLTEITIPSSVTKVDLETFKGCSSLEKVTLPESLVNIGGNAFNNCTSLEEITIPSAVSKIGGNAFSNCTSLKSIVIPDSVTEIQNETFRNCSKLSSVILPDSIKTIKYDAFNCCISLKTLDFPSELETVEKRAFAGCGFESVEFGDKIVTIGDKAFNGCTYLKEINLNTVSEIDDGSSANTPNTNINDLFMGCINLEKITVAESNENFSTIDGILFDKKANKLLVYPQAKSGASYDVLETVTVIDSRAFNYCQHIETVNIPESVSEIDRYSFYCCPSLKNVTINNPDCTIYQQSDGLLGDLTYTSYYTICNNYDEGSIFNVLKNLIGISEDTEDDDTLSSAISEAISDEHKAILTEVMTGNSILKDVFNIPDGEQYFNGIIYGHKNSTAQAYAKNCGYNFAVIGEEATVTTVPVTTTPVTTTTTITTTDTVTTNPVTTSTPVTTTVPVTTLPVTTPPAQPQGDITGDGELNLYDAIDICKCIMGMRELTEEEAKIADYNSDGKVDLYDAIGIAKWLMNSGK